MLLTLYKGPFMIDVKKIFDPLKLALYYEYIVNQHIYDEGDSAFHKQLTKQVVETYIDPLNLPKDANILDMGCGPGYFLDEMKSREYTNLTGITLSQGDVDICEKKEHTIKKYDLSFLPSKDGYHDESVDFIFLRHALERSPFPIFTLMEYNRVLKQGAKMYIEVPAPDCDRKHEMNSSHYSILGHNQLAALLIRTGFDIDLFNNLEFDLGVPTETGEVNTMKEKYYCIVVTKKRGLDIK